MFQNNKGQTSIEFLIITAIIFILALVSLSKFFEISDSTNSMILLKNHSLKELQKEKEFYFIEKIDDPESLPGVQNSVNLKIILNGPPNNDLESRIQSVSARIIEKTKFENVSINVLFVQ